MTDLAAPSSHSGLAIVPLLSTKLRAPRVRSGLVQRSHLLDLLKRGLDRPVCLISAPAGFGKTSLLSACIAECGPQVGNARNDGSSGRIAWLTLDEGDNDPVRFWQYAVAALGTVRSGIGASARALLAAISQTPTGQNGAAWLEAVATCLINDLDGGAAEGSGFPDAPLVFVLDDYHTIRNQAIHDAVAFFIEHLPPHAHLVILTRADPPLPLARLRVRDQLVEIRAADLRFRPDEIAAFLNRVMGLGLPAEAIESLGARTEGWAAGLHLAALSLQGRDAQSSERFIKDFKGTQQHVFGYLVEEVFGRQSPEVQDFLLHTSILSYLTAALCDAVTSPLPHTPFPSPTRRGEGGQGEGVRSSQAMLARLERENLFLVPLDEERRWYRYHPLFAEALRARLIQAEPTLGPELHRRAANWYEAQGQLVDAVRHALSAGDWEHVARLIETTYRRLVMDGEMVTLRAWLDAMPGAEVQARPRLALAYAWAMGYSGPFELQEQMLHAVEVAVGAPAWDPSREEPAAWDGDADSRALRGELLVLRAMLASLRWESRRAIELAQEAMWLLWPDTWAEFYQQPPTEPLAPEDLWLRAVILHALGNAYHLGGNVKSAETTYREALRLTMGRGPAPTPAFPMMALAAAVRLGQVLISRGRLRDAEWGYRHALEQVERRGGELLLFAGEVLIHLGELLAEQNRLAEAEERVREGVALCQRAVNPLAEVTGYLVLAQVAWARGDAEAAQAHIGLAEQLAARSGRDYVVPLVAAQRAWLNLVTRNFSAAARWAEELPRQRAARSDCPCIVCEREDLLLVGVCLARRRLAEAQTLLGEILQAAEAAGRQGAVIEALVLRALTFAAQGDRELARQALLRALTLAEPEGYVRVFVDRGEAMRTLIAECRMRNRDAETAALGAYLDRLIAAFAAPQTGASAPGAGPPSAFSLQPSALVEPLTGRELEILHLIAAGASNQQIAEQLVVSVGTVKGHTNHILGKLAAHNRTEAAARARELGLLQG